MKQTRSAGGIVLNPSGQVLVVSQHGTSWSLPKGHVEEGEDALEAARREIYEEAGVTALKLVRELGSYGRFKLAADGGEDHSEFKTIFMFVFETTEVELAPVDPANPEAKWVDREEAAALLTHPRDAEFYATHFLRA